VLGASSPSAAGSPTTRTWVDGDRTAGSDEGDVGGEGDDDAVASAVDDRPEGGVEGDDESGDDVESARRLGSLADDGADGESEGEGEGEGEGGSDDDRGEREVWPASEAEDGAEAEVERAAEGGGDGGSNGAGDGDGGGGGVEGSIEAAGELLIGAGSRPAGAMASTSSGSWAPAGPRRGGWSTVPRTLTARPR
jgi:hypothetical protein